MEPEDVAAAAAWSRERRLRLDLVFNGHGASPSDPLTRALLDARGAFGWVSHTFSHFHLDDVPGEMLETEVARNARFAAEHGLAIDVRELVTGEHSGLRHPALPAVLRTTGVRFLADDNSREPRQRRVGPALTVPRHPTNLYFNVCRRAAQLDEHHHLFTARFGRERGGGGVVRLAPATSWERFVQTEADTILGHVLANDPRPHYIHQSNLTGDRMAFDLLDAVLERHRALFACPLEQPTLAEAGIELARQVAWEAAARAHRACGYLQGGRVHVRTAERLAVPLTGVPGMAGEGSGWTDPIGPEDRDVAFALA
jgi:hypothetical protein